MSHSETIGTLLFFTGQTFPNQIATDEITHKSMAHRLLKSSSTPQKETHDSASNVLEDLHLGRIGDGAILWLRRTKELERSDERNGEVLSQTSPDHL
jgi:hypothetical protein